MNYKEKVDVDFITEKASDLNDMLDCTIFNIDEDTDIKLEVGYVNYSYVNEVISDLKQIIDFLEKYEIVEDKENED